MYDSFSFLVLARNHQEYVIEHLESIKYLVQTYGANRRIELLINDDCSSDITVKLVDQWLSRNSSLFYRIVFVKQDVNIGTCKSLVNLLASVQTKQLKITAADDVYTSNDIFSFSEHTSSHAFISGMSLVLVNSHISYDFRFSFCELVTNYIYQSRPLLSRFLFSAVNNACSIIYNPVHLLSQEVVSFLGQFDLVEDWPLQLAISDKAPHSSFYFSHKCYVLYRRTPGSSYMVASTRVARDNERIFSHILSRPLDLVSRIRLVSRKISNLSQTRTVRHLLNVDLWIYWVQALPHLPMILHHLYKDTRSLASYRKHYQLIREKSRQYYQTVKP